MAQLTSILINVKFLSVLRVNLKMDESIILLYVKMRSLYMYNIFFYYHTYVFLYHSFIVVLSFSQYC